MKISKLELRRQIFHMLLGTSTVVLLNYGLVTPLLLFITIVKGFIISFLSKKIRIPVIQWFLDVFERKEDLKKFPGRGAIYYAIGCFFVVLLFPKDIAMASIMILAFGDSISHLAGIHIGRISIFSDKKFLEGMLFGLLAAFASSAVFVKPLEALLASLSAMFVESIEIRIKANTINDNLIVPVVAGIVIWLVRLV